ncbi:hypothetical protein [Flavobacterium notoginsengisoli]|uniref:hypothetical protein n=1 Tax=Flavobacterium notoginsengisoli TaxID=1478199 RepID=UPI00363DD4AA
MKPKHIYNQDIIKIIQSRHSCSADYIRKSIRGDRVGSISKIIKAEYNKLNNEAIKAIKKQINKL